MVQSHDGGIFGFITADAERRGDKKWSLTVHASVDNLLFIDMHPVRDKQILRYRNVPVAALAGWRARGAKFLAEGDPNPRHRSHGL